MSPYLSEGAENHGEHAVFLYYVAYLCMKGMMQFRRSDVISTDFFVLLHREQRNFLFTMEQ